MRDSVVARRALLAFAAGLWLRPAEAKKGLRVVAIDPGHGGADPGAISPHGLYEKTITLSAARELARRLDATGRYHPVMTRHHDVFVSLKQRVASGRGARAELFLSLHADALPDSALHGLSVYTLAEKASDRIAARLALHANKDDSVAGVHLSRQPRDVGAILFDLARRHTDNRAIILAHAIVEDLGRAVPLLEKPHRAAAFAVLTAPDMPSALVELGCLSNPGDERLLPHPAYQRRIADGLVRAIDDYFSAATIAA